MNPVLSPLDNTIFTKLMQELPQSLIIEAEYGLDDERLVDRLAKSQKSEVFMLEPEKDKLQIGVDQVRELVDSIKTFSHDRRIVIIRQTEIMTESAQNAMLKILEEPINNLHLILVVSDSSLLLPTIVSRCQVTVLHRTTAVQDKSLIEDEDIDEKTKQQILFLANGRPNLIRKMIKQPKVFNTYKNIATDVKVVMAGNSYSSLQAIYKYSTDRGSALMFIDVLKSFIKFHIKRQGLTAVSQQFVDRLHETSDILRSNGNVKLALVRLVVK